MPFCCQCGQSVSTRDVYCATCGARQPSSAPPAVEYMQGISPRTASLLCYVPILGWIVAIVVLASARFRDNVRVRFHAFQGLYLFVAWLIVDWVLSPMFVFWGPFHHVFPALFKARHFRRVDFHDHQDFARRDLQAAHPGRSGREIRLRAALAQSGSIPLLSRGHISCSGACIPWQ